MRRKWLYVVLAVSVAGNVAAWGVARWRAGRWQRMYPRHDGVGILGYGPEKLQALVPADARAMDSLRRSYVLLDGRVDLLAYDYAGDSGELAAGLDELVDNSVAQYRLAAASARRAFAQPDSARHVRRWRKMMCMAADSGGSKP